MEAVAPVQGVSQTSLASPSPTKHQSLLFPSLISRLSGVERLSVLDVGPAFPETVEFFSRFRCRLHFADLYSEPLVLQGSAHLDPEELRVAFERSMALPRNTAFDLCLLWDFPNYVDDRALRALNDVLRPHVHGRTVGHGFAVRTADTRIRNQWYGVEQAHLFNIRQPGVAQSRFFPHPQAILINLLTCFDIDRGMLLPDGRLEVLLNAVV